LSDTQKKIEDTILKLEQRLKFAKTPEQWDNIKNRIERLQAGLTRSKTGVAEGGVGVVKGGSDPRYSTATMGDQNAVDGNTLGREMRAFGLTGRAAPRAKEQRPVRSQVGKGLREEQELARLIHDYFG